MRISVNGGIFGGYHVSGIGNNKTGVSSHLTGRAKSDQVVLSKQVLSVIEIQNRIRQIEQAKENANNSPEVQQLESMRKAMKALKACSKIAARIRAGDKVPLKDLQYLMKNDPQMYQMAMASRKPKENPKEWKSAIPKEEQAERQSEDGAEKQTGDVQVSTGTEGSSSGGSGVGTDGGGEK